MVLQGSGRTSIAEYEAGFCRVEVDPPDIKTINEIFAKSDGPTSVNLKVVQLPTANPWSLFTA